MTPLGVAHDDVLVAHTPSDLKPAPCRRSAEAPAPLTTILTSPMSRPVRSSALIRPAVMMMAVPCWSSWKTGMSIASRRRCSMTKHCGALMSSRLMPPHVAPRKRTQLTNSSTSSVDTSRSMPSTSAKRLNRTALPSITGLEPSAPRLPRPSTAVPVGDDGDQIALGRVIVGQIGVLGDFETGMRHPGRIEQRQVALGGQRFRSGDFDFAGTSLGMNQQRLLGGHANGGVLSIAAFPDVSDS